MRIKKSVAVLIMFVFCFGTRVHAVHFGEYYKNINLAEELFIQGHPDQSFLLYDSVFKKYSNPYVFDCYKAAQFAYSVGDTNHFLNYLTVAFSNGMPYSAVIAAPILKSILQNKSLVARLEQIYENNSRNFTVNESDFDELAFKNFTIDSLQLSFAQSDLRDSCIAIEQLKKEDEIRKFVRDKYLKAGVFPSEKILGITQTNTYTNFRSKYNKVLPGAPLDSGKVGYLKDGTKVLIGNPRIVDYELSNASPLNFFIHSTCTIAEYQPYLWQSVLNGYLHPKYYGMLEEIGISWNRNSLYSRYAKICNYPVKDAYYNILGNELSTTRTNVFVNTPDLLVKVESNREAHYIQKYSVDVQKRNLEKEKGFKLFFGWGSYL